MHRGNLLTPTLACCSWLFVAKIGGPYLLYFIEGVFGASCASAGALWRRHSGQAPDGSKIDLVFRTIPEIPLPL
jgi:hypothetical protein